MKLNIFSDLRKPGLVPGKSLSLAQNYVFCFGENLNLHYVKQNENSTHTKQFFFIRLTFWLLYYLQQFLFYSVFFFFGLCCILFPSVGLLTGVEGSGMVSLDEVPADDWLSSVSPPMSMSGVPASCSWETSTSSSSLPSSSPASATLDAVLQQRIETKIYLRFFTNCYITEIICMNVCM